MPEEGSIDQHKSKEPEEFANHMQLSCTDNLTTWDSLLLKPEERQKPGRSKTHGLEPTAVSEGSHSSSNHWTSVYVFNKCSEDSFGSHKFVSNTNRIIYPSI